MYLGVSLGPTAVTDHRLIEHLARTMLVTPLRIAKECRKTLHQHRTAVKLFVFSFVDYVLYLQQIS